MLLLAAYGRGGIDRFRQESPADYLAQLEEVRGYRGARRRRPPLRPRLPARLARGARALCRRPKAYRCTSTRTSSRARSRSASPSTGSARSSSWPRRAASARTRLSSTPRTPTRRELDLLAEAGARVCLCPTTEANLGDGFAPVQELCERGHRHVHRLGLERAHRPTRGAARAGGNRPPPRGQAQRRLGLEPPLLRRRRGSSSPRARELARRRGRTSSTRRWRASTTCMPASSSAAPRTCSPEFGPCDRRRRGGQDHDRRAYLLL